MKEIIKITMSLTAICVAAALILGAVFAKTEHARKDIEEKMQQETIQSLLGFGPGKKIPESLKIYAVYRYVVNSPKGTVLGYVIPLKDKGFSLILVDLEGKPVQVLPIKADATAIADRGQRDAVVNELVGKGSKATYAETFYVAEEGGKRLGYVVPGVTQGFKTFINLMVSLNPDFTLTGIEIVRSEEDPGLGDEIKKDFFKNQFDGKSLESIKTLKVVKEPLPSDYYLALEPEKAKKQGIKPEELAQIKEKHLKDDIYALTGATISSRAVTDGVKNTVRKFVYRLGILTDALKQEKVPAAFLGEV